MFKRNFLNILAAVLMLFSLTGCLGEKLIPPGHVGVKINLYGTNRGVQDTTIVTGRVWYSSWSTQIFDFPTFMQYKVWTRDENEGNKNDESITFVTLDKIPVNVDVSVAYQFEAEKVPELFVTFRQPPEIIADTYIRSRVRDAFVRNGSIVNAMDILGAGVSRLDASVLETVNTEMKQRGILFDYVSVLNHPRIPEAIQTAINQAIESTQRARQATNQVAVVTAEAAQRVARATGEANATKAQAEGEASATLTKAQAQAKANVLLSQSLTPELVQYNTIKQWNGKLPVYSGSGAVPFLNLNNK